VTSVSPASGARGSSVAVTMSGSNLCGVTLSTNWSGLTFSNVTFDNDYGNSASATFNIASSAPTGTASVTLSGAGGSTSFSLNIASNLPPAITGISPDTVTNGAVTTVRVSGSNLAFGQVSIPQLKVDPSDANRSFPSATVINADPSGTWMQVQINATDTSIIDFYNLVVSTSAGQDRKEFRVIPQGPIVDMWTPASPQRGQVYILSIVGRNLTGAVNAAEPDKIRISNVQSSDERLTAVMEIFLTTPGGASTVGPTSLIVQDLAGRQASININITDVGSEAGTNMTEGSTGMPPVYLQVYSRSPTSSPSVNFSNICSVSKNILNLHWQFPLVYCPQTGTFGSCLQGLNLGDQVQVGGFVLSLYFRVDVNIYWLCFPISYPRCCVTAVVGYEIPGSNSGIVQAAVCSVGPNPSVTGTFSVGQASITFSGTSCAEIVQESPASGGVAGGTVELVNCCTSTLPVTASGTTFNGVFVNGASITRSFNLSSEPAAALTPAAACLPSPANPVKNREVITINVVGGRWATQSGTNQNRPQRAGGVWTDKSQPIGFPITFSTPSTRTLDTNTVAAIAAVICETCSDVSSTGALSPFAMKTLIKNDPQRDSGKVNMYFVRDLDFDLADTFLGDNRPVIGDQAGDRTVAHELGHVQNLEHYIVSLAHPDTNNLMIKGGNGDNLSQGQIRKAYQYTITEKSIN